MAKSSKRPHKQLRPSLRKMIVEQWEENGWPVGNWVYGLAYAGEEGSAIIITTKAKVVGMGREVTSFKVNHPEYNYVFYTE